jgi:glyoxylase-like metal-dependent hydrolase (beta-lactamase superfamily II)
VLVAGIASELTATNCWVLALGDGEQCLIVDPGIGVVGPLDELIREHRLHPVAVLLTHGHLDHTFSVLPVCQARDVAAYIHPADRSQVADPWTWMGLAPGAPIMGLTDITVAEPDDLRVLTDGEGLNLAGLDLTVRHAPGHSLGSVVFGLAEVDEPGSLFSGDVLFAGSIGRTDLPGGSIEQMWDSLDRVILPLDDEIVVHPGHGPSTTIGRERRTNPFLLELAGPR